MSLSRENWNDNARLQIVFAILALLAANLASAAIGYRNGARRQYSKCESELENLRFEVLHLQSEAVRRGFAEFKTVVSETEQQFRWKEQK